MCTGGLLAAAISKMDGIGGKPGWAWIFILEGLFTVLCAIASFWILADFPENAKFLSTTESMSSLNPAERPERYGRFLCVGQGLGSFAGYKPI